MGGNRMKLKTKLNLLHITGIAIKSFFSRLFQKYVRRFVTFDRKKKRDTL